MIPSSPFFQSINSPSTQNTTRLIVGPSSASRSAEAVGTATSDVVAVAELLAVALPWGSVDGAATFKKKTLRVSFPCLPPGDRGETVPRELLVDETTSLDEG